MPTKKTTKKATAKKAAKKAPVKKSVAKKTTKKATKKKTVKKTAVKKKRSDKKVLVCANENECFWTTNGEIFRDLQELRDAFEKMSSDVFSFHVGKDRNDFADWVEHILGDVDCSTALRKAKKPNTARTVVVRHLRYYDV